MSSRKGWHLIFCMEENKICSFFGHRDVEITDRLYAITTTEILKAVDFGCRIFYFGGYGDFDDLCYQIVTKIQEENPDQHQFLHLRADKSLSRYRQVFCH